MSWSSYRSRGFSSYGGFAPYVPVAKRREQAAKAAAKAAKNGLGWSPVSIAGRKIATTFWGRAWCEHLESYSDYENRLPRGRTYVRNGSVVDLQIATGVITARVQGSSLYSEEITIKPLAPARWKAIKAACAGKVTSLVGLLQGKLPEEVLRVITDRASGLFPAPDEIALDCSCPDSASLCKHLAAVLYGVGARLDTRPELLFLLRGVDHQELVAEAIEAASRGAAGAGGADAGAALTDSNLADVFGIDIGGTAEPVARETMSVPPVAPVAEAATVPAKPFHIRHLTKSDIAKFKREQKALTDKAAAAKSSAPAKAVAIPVVKRPRGRPRKAVTVVDATSAAVSTRAKVVEDLDAVVASLKKMRAKPAKKGKAGA
jgi:uncharacterized Zn finger protein